MKSLLIKLLFFGCVLGNMSCNTQQHQNDKSFVPSDKNATDATVELFSTLNSRMEKGIMLGHQDDLAYGNKWYSEPGRSDVKSVCGDYPAAFGWNIGNIENGVSYNSDSISFLNLRSYIKQVNGLGGISIISWISNYKSVINDCNCTDIQSVNEAFQVKSSHKKYILYLDKLAEFFNSLKSDDGKLIPVVFQPFNGYNTPGKYWWSSDRCTASEFKNIWIFTVNYLRNTRDVHNVLYSYTILADSSSTSLTDYYPGNDYVDLIGISLTLNQENDPTGKLYMQALNRNLAVATQFALKNNKIAALTDTGMEGIKIPDYFTNYLYPIVSQYKLSYIMFGKNSWNDEKHYFIPIPGHPASEDFDKFSKNPKILTSSKLG
jgi:hypothetical protein